MNAFDFVEKGASFSRKVGAVEKKTSSCFYFSKLILYLIPLRLYQLNRVSGDGLINCSKDFLSLFIQAKLLISMSNLFHSRIAETTESETTFNIRLNTDY